MCSYSNEVVFLGGILFQGNTYLRVGDDIILLQNSSIILMELFKLSENIEIRETRNN